MDNKGLTLLRIRPNSFTNTRFTHRVWDDRFLLGCDFANGFCLDTRMGRSFGQRVIQYLPTDHRLDVQRWRQPVILQNRCYRSNLRVGFRALQFNSINKNIGLKLRLVHFFGLHERASGDVIGGVHRLGGFCRLDYSLGSGFKSALYVNNTNASQNRSRERNECAQKRRIGGLLLCRQILLAASLFLSCLHFVVHTFERFRRLTSDASL